MSYSDDLDWLARNITDQKMIGWFSRVGNVVSQTLSVGGCGSHKGLFTAAEVMGRRAELQNKPSWDEAPVWAEWLAQDSYGCWGWFQQRPVSQSLAWFVNGGNYHISSPGNLVIGCWQDTPERRPDMHKTTPEIDTYAERVQETSKSMRDWHERGELPPVGTECVIWSEGRFPPAECKIVAYSMERVCVRWNGNGDLDVIDLQFKNQSECKFRPIRTERDEAIEAMKAHCPYPGSWETTYRLFAESLYDAGYRAGGFE